MHVFIVHAHPEPRSFNGAFTALACETLPAAGHTVEVSDLYAMGWDPVSDRRNFATVADPDYYKQQREELHALAHRGFAADIEAEFSKLRRADVLILQFPLWWFSVPAILKGWVDRVFSMGTAYGHGRFYDRGGFAGKRAMLSVTIGGAETMYSPQGLNGHIDAILYPLNHGILRFTGFDVLPPYLAYGVNRGTVDDRRAMLDAYRDRLLTLQSTAPIAYPALDEFDPNTFERRLTS